MRIFLSIFIISALSLFNLSSVSAEERAYSSQVQASTTAELENYQANQLIVKFKDSISANQKETFFENNQVEQLSELGNGTFSLISIPSGSDIHHVSEQLLRNPEVELIEPNYTVQTSYKPADHGYSKQWYAPKIKMPSAWNTTLGKSDIKVAVIDAGLQVTHPDLKGQTIKPYNAVTGETSLPSSIHGTHVAGIIAAAKNTIGITGIAPNVKIIPVNVFEGDEADIYTVAEGIDYAVKAGAKVINLSLTTEDYTEVLNYSIQSAVKKGVVVVAAVGNDQTSREQYPAAYENVIAVSATTKSDTRANFSNYGSYINLSAPGVDIYSTAPTNSYRTENGTSMATPIVSGVSALILSKNPYLSPAEVTNILQNSSVDLGTKGWDRYFGYGRVDANQALAETPAPLSTIKTSSKAFTNNGKNQLSLSFSAKKGVKISLYIKDANNKIVRKLVTNKAWNGGTYSIKWNGEMDNQAYAPQGKIRIMVKITNGKHTRYSGTNVTITDKVPPAIALTKKSMTFSTTTKQKLNIPFHANKKAQITAVLYDGAGKKVQTLATKKSINGGSQTLTWDGKNSSEQQAKPGTYTLKFSISDAANRVGKLQTMTITVKK